MKSIDAKELGFLQEKYGKPSVGESLEAYYRLCSLVEQAKGIDPPHNFQLERSDIVRYIYDLWEVLKPLYMEGSDVK